MYRVLVLVLVFMISGCDSGADDKNTISFTENEVVAMPVGYDLQDTTSFLRTINPDNIELQMQQSFADYEELGVRFYFSPLLLHPSNGDANQLMVKIDIEAPQDWPHREAMLKLLHDDVQQYLDAYNSGM